MDWYRAGAHLDVVKNRRLQDNPLLKRVMARARPRPKLSLPSTYTFPKGAEASAITIQCFFRVMKANSDVARRRSDMILRARKRFLEVPNSSILDRPEENVAGGGTLRRTLQEPLDLDNNALFRQILLHQRVLVLKNDNVAQVSFSIFHSCLFCL